MELLSLAVASVVLIASAVFAFIFPKRMAELKSGLFAKPSERDYSNAALAFAAALGLAVIAVGSRSPYFQWQTPAAIAAMLILAFAEEIFFRGICQKYLGNAGQAIVYSLSIAMLFATDFGNYLVNFAALFLVGLSAGKIAETRGLRWSMLLRVGLVISVLAGHLWPAAMLSALLLLAPFGYYAAKGLGMREAMARLELRKVPIGRLVSHGLALFFITVLAVNVIASFANAAGFYDAEKATAKVAEQSQSALLVAITLGPIAEEVLFRGFLRKKIGALPSSLLFGMAHAGSGSLVLIVAGTAFGLILCGYADREKSIVPGIIGHAVYNAASIAAIFGA